MVNLPQNRWDLLDGLTPDEPPFVSVVIPHFRQQAELDRTLLALERQDHPASRLEIVVVDDGSPKPPRVPSGVILLTQEDRGFRAAAARNAGAAVASGSVLCFLDADTSPEPAYVTELSRLPALCPDIVAVGRRRHADFTERRITPTDPVENAGPRVELDEPRWLVDAYRATRDLLDADDRSYRFVIGAVSACTTELFRETGGYDESFQRYGGEDWEWAYRAWLAGALLAHVPAAVAWHDGPEWSDRDGASVAVKNAEALQLARLIPVPGSAPRGLRGEFPDVVVTTPTADPDDGLAGSWFVSLDSIATELPHAALPGDERSRERCRLEVAVLRPASVAPGALRRLLARVAKEQLGRLDVIDDQGLVVLRISSVRARSRVVRRGDPGLFPTVSEQSVGIAVLAEPVDVEAYLGGWD